MPCQRCQQMRTDMWENFKDWYAEPLKDGVSVGRWFAFFGLVIVLTAAWGLILRQIEES